MTLHVCAKMYGMDTLLQDAFFIFVTNNKLRGITNDTSMRLFRCLAGDHEVMQLLAGSRPAG